MREELVDIWTVNGLKVITANGTVKKDGCAVLGAGVAKQAVDHFPELPQRLGARLKQYGNHVFLFHDLGLITFPVKHSWDQTADLNLIKRSCLELVGLYHTMLELSPPNTDLPNIFLPRPGVGNGRLNWTDVKSAIFPLLPDFVTVIDLPEKKEVALSSASSNQAG